MHPVLLNFHLGDAEVVLGAYGTLYVLAWVVALGLGTVIAWRQGVRWRRALLAYGGALLVGIAGARLLDIATSWHVYTQDPAQIHAFHFRGFSVYGGLILALAAGALLARALGLPLWRLADSAVPGLVAGIVLLRTGCFLQGCCFGTVTSLPWGVTFPPGSPAWSWQLASGESGLLGFAGLVRPVHPTQIYEMIAALLFGGIAIWLMFKWRPVAGRSTGGAIDREAAAGDPRRGPRASPFVPGVPFLVFLLGFTLFRVPEYYLRARSLTATDPGWFYPVLYAVIIAASATLLIWKMTRSGADRATRPR
jgi:phosphatidylglycerol---prolipoprotein diacylglyceryl transferase